MKTCSLQVTLLGLGILTLMSGCGDSNLFRDHEPFVPPATTILDLQVEPNDTLRVGETATFTVVIADSAATDIRFLWSLSGTFDDGFRQENTIAWIAPDNPRTYGHKVTVDRGGDYRTVQKIFTVVVLSANGD